MINLNFQPDASGFLGFNLGELLLNQKPAFEAIVKMGFGNESYRSMFEKSDQSGQYVFSKTAQAGDADKFDQSVFFECDEEGVLVKLLLFVGIKSEKGLAQDAQYSAHQLRDILIDQIGKPVAFMDNIAAWSKTVATRGASEVAYLALWNPEGDKANLIDRGPYTSTDSFMKLALYQAIDACALVNISASQDGVVATLELTKARAKPEPVSQAKKMRDKLLSFQITI